MATYPGIKPGGLTSESEAMVLVCFLIDHTKVPLKEDNILNIVAATRVANYFDTASAIARLLENLNIMHDDNGCLQLTPTGSAIADELSSTLPYTVRQDALDGLVSENMMQHNLDDNDFIITENENGGCEIEIRMNDSGKCLFSLKMSGFDKQMANIMKDRFYKNPAEIYQSSLKVLLNYDPKTQKEEK